MNSIISFLRKSDVWIVALFSLIISIISTIYYFNHHDILAYNDAVSHLQIARSIVDYKQPGIQQIGGVWLPLQHILMIPFVAFYSLWQNGLAGSIISMGAFITANLFIFKIVKFLTKSSTAGFAGVALFAVNRNILYMQSTPMTEMLLFATLFGGIYYFIRWYSSRNNKDLIFSGIWIAFATLVRYEAWMLMVVAAFIIFIDSVMLAKNKTKGFGQSLLFLTIASFGIVLWILWSLVIFGNALYWLDGPYSSKHQQNILAYAGQLPTRHHILTSIITYAKAVELNVGPIILIITALSILFLLYSYIKKSKKDKRLLLVALLLSFSPILLEFLALFFGNTVIYTKLNYTYNIRYGLMALPFIIICISYALSEIKTTVIAWLSITLIVVVLILVGSPITLREGLIGPDGSGGQSQAYLLASKFRHIYKSGSILTANSQTPTVPIHDIGLSLSHYISNGDYLLWNNALRQPQKYVNYVIVLSRNKGLDSSIVPIDYTKSINNYQKYFNVIYDKYGYEILAKKSLGIAAIPSNVTPSSTNKLPIVNSKPITASQTNTLNTVVKVGESETSIVQSDIATIDDSSKLSSGQLQTVTIEMVDYVGNNNLIYPGQTVSINMTYLQQLINNTLGVSATIYKSTPTTTSANVIVQTGDSQYSIVAYEINALYPNNQLTVSQIGYVDSAMVTMLGDHNLIYPGQVVNINLSTLRSLVAQSQQLSSTPSG